MGTPQARTTDIHICTVPPAFTSPILPPCAVTVLVGKLPAARALADMTMSGPVPPAPPVPHMFPKGSMTVLICKLPALRLGDTCMMGGPIIKGEFTVLTGG